MPMTVPQLAQVLFSSPLQPSDNPSPAQVRSAIDECLCACGQSGCTAYVAQEAGDHPEAYAARMRWALAQVYAAYQRSSLIAA
jgi:hypothetical protein